jgi:hypothetical protein
MGRCFEGQMQKQNGKSEINWFPEIVTVGDDTRPIKLWIEIRAGEASPILHMLFPPPDMGDARCTVGMESKTSFPLIRE